MSILSLEHSLAKVDYSGHHVPGEPDLPFADKIAAVAAYHRSADTDFDGWLAVQIDRLAGMARAWTPRAPTTSTTATPRCWLTCTVGGADEHGRHPPPSRPSASP